MKAWRLGAAVLNSARREAFDQVVPSWRARKAVATLAGAKQKRSPSGHAPVIYGMQRLRPCGYVAPRRRSLRDVRP